MSGWEVLGYDSTPTPGDPDAINLLAARLLNQAQQADERTSQLQAVADNSRDLRMQGNYAPRFLEILSQLPASHLALTTSYRTCSKSLSAYASRLSEAQAQSAQALANGTEADTNYWQLLDQFCSLPIPGVIPEDIGRNLNGLMAENMTRGEDMATQENAIDIGNAAEEQEFTRQVAIRDAENAENYLNQTQALCAQQIGDALPQVGPAGEPGVTAAPAGPA